MEVVCLPVVAKLSNEKYKEINELPKRTETKQTKKINLKKIRK